MRIASTSAQMISIERTIRLNMMDNSSARARRASSEFALINWKNVCTVFLFSSTRCLADRRETRVLLCERDVVYALRQRCNRGSNLEASQSNGTIHAKILVVLSRAAAFLRYLASGRMDRPHSELGTGTVGPKDPLDPSQSFHACSFALIQQSVVNSLTMSAPSPD